jgi:predicted RNA-binding protein associated with RNAse of E/G family
MHLGEDEVSYTDLMLDLWIEHGELRWEDEDELEDAMRSGLLSLDEREHIEHARNALTDEHEHIMSEVREALRTFGVAGPQLANG